MPRPLATDVHQHFKTIPRKDATFKTRRAKCNYCGVVIAFTATKGRDHLGRCSVLAGKSFQLRLARFIYCQGLPTDFFDSKSGIELLCATNPEIKLPKHDQLIGPLLATVFGECIAQVEERLSQAEWLNVLLDAPADITSPKLVKVFVQIPSVAAFYWTTISMQTMDALATNSLLPILLEVTGSDLARINSITIDVSYATEAAIKQAILQCPDLSHCVWMLRDSHGVRPLQLNTEAYVAWCLDPRTRVPNEPYDAERVTTFIQYRYGLDKPEDSVRIQILLMEFRLQQSIFQISVDSAEQSSPYEFWLHIRANNPDCVLVAPALRLFSCLATSNPPERTFLDQDDISNKVGDSRSLDKSAFVYYNSKALRCGTN